jgi:hypothetical protein
MNLKYYTIKSSLNAKENNKEEIKRQKDMRQTENKKIRWQT